MSTDRKRLSSAIQRIAREDPDIRAIIADYKNRGGVGSTSATVAGADDGRQICCDGSSSGGNNPGSQTKDPSEGGQDGLDPNDPANLDDMGPGSLSGVTDCATGEPVCFAGADWVPPEGFDEESLIYDPEYYWRGRKDGGGGASQGYFGTEYEARRFALDGNPICSYSVNEEFVYSGLYGVGSCDGALFTFSVQRFELDAGDDPIPPGPVQWPSDGCINLAVKGGKFVASKYDPDVTGGNGWLKGKEEVELCDEFGNSFTARASGSQPGGWKTISAQNPGDGYLYDATGAKVARISGSEYSDPSI